jgi:site-specific recombinase XerD
MWKNGILSWMQEKKMTLYSADAGEEFIHGFITDGYVSARERDVIRSVHVLTDFMNEGCIRRKTFTPVEHPLKGEIGRQMQNLIEHLRSLRRSQITIHDYELYLSRFITFLEHERVYTVSAIREFHVLKFLSTTENNKINIASSLRVLFRFWYEQKIIEEDFSDLFNNYKWVRQEKIPSFYTASEVSTIEDSVERSSGVGKRNYAMLLLASRLGLRASDIANLKFNNLDWEQNEIHLTQYKTGNPVTLPLLSDVGNAIIVYLQHGRFKSDTPHVFLSARAPYVPATKSAVCAALSCIILQTEVETENRHHGPHSLRHSLAGRLLDNNVPIQVISETLGHTKTDTTMTYLRIDVTSLLKCSLPVPPVSDSFYTQKGGVFYE